MLSISISSLNQIGSYMSVHMSTVHKTAVISLNLFAFVMPKTAWLNSLPLVFVVPEPSSISYILSHINNHVLTTVPLQKTGQVKASMPVCYIAAALDVWPGSFMSACSGTVLPLSFTEEIQTLEGVSIAENVNVKGLRTQNPPLKLYQDLQLKLLHHHIKFYLDTWQVSENLDPTVYWPCDWPSAKVKVTESDMKG